MPLVLDASIALAWVIDCTDDEQRYAEAVAIALKDAGTIAHVPAIFEVECAIALRREHDRRALSAERLNLAAQRIDALPLSVHHVPSGVGLILELSRRHGLHVADALYLHLAETLKLPLATLDASVRRAYVRLGVGLFEAPARSQE
jgi:predicted nucleic acid-binding protein